MGVSEQEHLVVSSDDPVAAVGLRGLEPHI